MNPDDVAAFLRAHPRFFDDHPGLIDSIRVTHPHGGRAIPLAERQLVALRDKARVLETRLGELIQFGEENDAISERIHRLSVAMVGARDFAELAQSLYFHLREDFTVPHVVLRVWAKSVPVDFPESESISDEQRQYVETAAAAHCTAAADTPCTAWFGDMAQHVRSVAHIPLGDTSIFGMLLLGSEDAQRFYPEMGTLYLRRLGDLCAAGVSARL